MVQGTQCSLPAPRRSTMHYATSPPTRVPYWDSAGGEETADWAFFSTSLR